VVGSGPNGLAAADLPITGTPGTTKLHRLEENIAAADVELSPDDLRKIEDAQLTTHGARYGEASQRMVDR
jgi:aryl-alcohol dehydrogenase-like predicted oxidoreductase